MSADTPKIRISELLRKVRNQFSNPKQELELRIRSAERHHDTMADWGKKANEAAVKAAEETIKAARHPSAWPLRGEAHKPDERDASFLDIPCPNASP